MLFDRSQAALSLQPRIFKTFFPWQCRRRRQLRPLTIRGKVIFIYFSSTNYTSTMEQEASGSTPLFAVFLLSIVSIVLIPYTLNSLFGGDEDDKEVR